MLRHYDDSAEVEQYRLDILKRRKPTRPAPVVMTFGHIDDDAADDASPQLQQALAATETASTPTEQATP